MMFAKIKSHSQMVIYTAMLDNDVAVNILPLQEAGLLAKAKVV